MTEQPTQNDRTAGEQRESSSGSPSGFIVFAGVIMIMSGGFQALAGLVALFENANATSPGDLRPPNVVPAAIGAFR